MNWYGTVRIALLAILLLAGLTGRVYAQEDKMMGGEKMMEAMMAHHQEMMAQMERSEAKIDSLVAAMNDATGNEKMDTMSALLEELVGQRKAMHEMMQQMHARMMQGMEGMHDKEGEAEGDDPSSHH